MDSLYPGLLSGWQCTVHSCCCIYTVAQSLLVRMYRDISIRKGPIMRVTGKEERQERVGMLVGIYYE